MEKVEAIKQYLRDEIEELKNYELEECYSYTFKHDCKVAREEVEHLLRFFDEYF